MTDHEIINELTDKLERLWNNCGCAIRPCEHERPDNDALLAEIEAKASRIAQLEHVLMGFMIPSEYQAGDKLVDEGGHQLAIEDADAVGVRYTIYTPEGDPISGGDTSHTLFLRLVRRFQRDNAKWVRAV